MKCGSGRRKIIPRNSRSSGKASWQQSLQSFLRKSLTTRGTINESNAVLQTNQQSNLEQENIAAAAAAAERGLQFTSNNHLAENVKDEM